MTKQTRKTWIIVSLVSPGVALFAFAVLFPLLFSAFLGLTDFPGYGEIRIIGLKNYSDILFRDDVFWKSLLHALELALAFILIQHPIAIFFSILIDSIGKKLEKLFRALVFVPCVISVVVTTQLWVSLLNPEYGPLNKLLGALGLGFLQREWLADPRTAIGSIIAIAMWQGLGWAILIYYAGLKGIPEELYEAARIDGAVGLKAARYVTLPLLMPVIRVNVTLALLAALKTMETVFLSTGGGPGDRTQFIANYLYTKAFNTQEYGYANAISLLFVAICLLVTFANNRLLKSDSLEF